MVNGKAISSEQQQALYDDIKNDRCTRCHKKGRLRRNCPDTTPQKWEQRFDAQKANYWVSIAKWQAKATSTTPPRHKDKPSYPKKVSKGKADQKQHHMNVIDCGSDKSEIEESEDENTPQTRMTLFDEDETKIGNPIVIPQRQANAFYMS
jgi:hypothetical protein